jgi:hypothetical protein
MMPIWGDERRRTINLGGAASPAPSHAAILDQAKARRQEREDNRRREESAVRVQAWWRGVKETMLVKAEMKRVFAGDIQGIRGLRCLVLVGRDDEVLAMWSAAMVNERELRCWLMIPAYAKLIIRSLQRRCLGWRRDPIRRVGWSSSDKRVSCFSNP